MNKIELQKLIDEFKVEKENVSELFTDAVKNNDTIGYIVYGKIGDTFSFCIHKLNLLLNDDTKAITQKVAISQTRC